MNLRLPDLVMRALLFIGGLVCSLYLSAQEAETGSIIRWSEAAKSLDHAHMYKHFNEDLERPLLDFLSGQLVLENQVRIEVSERPYGYYDADDRTVVVPLSNIYRVHDDLKARFPQQEDVQRSILSAAIQFYLMSELIRAITVELELRISGWDAERIDALTTVLLLESSTVDQPYLLDAAEEFLLIDRAAPSIQSQKFKTEFEADEYRLSQILCVMKAYDAEDASAPAFDQGNCSGQYEAAMSYWANTLGEHLTEGAQLSNWAAQPDWED